MTHPWLNFWTRRRDGFRRGFSPMGDAALPELPGSVSAGQARRGALVKDRPVSLEQRYSLLEQSTQADEIFVRLKQRLFAAMDARQAGPTVFREGGRLAPGRPYFFVKRAGEKGWLCERSGAGWLLTPAEKIVERNLFLRDDQSVDAVELYVAQDRVTMPRVRSRTMGDGLLALAVYEQKLLQQMGWS